MYVSDAGMKGAFLGSLGPVLGKQAAERRAALPSVWYHLPGTLLRLPVQEGARPPQGSSSQRPLPACAPPTSSATSSFSWSDLQPLSLFLVEMLRSHSNHMLLPEPETAGG